MPATPLLGQSNSCMAWCLQSAVQWPACTVLCCVYVCNQRKRLVMRAVMLACSQILHGRSEKRQLGSRKGNTFSVARFAAVTHDHTLPTTAVAGGSDGDQGDEGGGQQQQQLLPGGAAVDAKEFWGTLLPEAVAAHEEALTAAQAPVVCGLCLVFVSFVSCNFVRCVAAAVYTGGI